MSTDTATLPATGTYAIDPAHTEVGFVARHLIGTKVRGRFTEASGTFTVADPIESSTLEAEVNAASIHTNQSMRDDHLRTNDFL
ncbi:MAG TPA: YceI family protein, partial [Acidimicrobiales bacterium]